MENKITTTLSGLLSLINQSKERVFDLSIDVKNAAIVQVHEELDGRKTIVSEDLDFDAALSEYQSEQSKLEAFKNALMTHNSITRIPNGMTIVEAMNHIAKLRSTVSLLNGLCTNKSSKLRSSDGNGISAYYKCTDLKYNRDDMDKARLRMTDLITNLETDIATTNAKTEVIINL